MSTEKHDEPKFKVVDRRRFHEDGTTREGPDVAPEPPPRAEPLPAAPSAAGAATKGGASSPGAAPKPGAPQQPAGTPASKPAAPAEDAPGGLSFSIFIQSLAQQALMQLGLIPWPHGQRELHLEQARDTVDILQLLKAKTKGNLNAEETQLIDTVLYELKMSWVEVQQAIARSKGAPMPKPPGR
jgi:hypothetical protein